MDLVAIGQSAGVIMDWSMLAAVVVLWRWLRYLHARVDGLAHAQSAGTPTCAYGRGVMRCTLVAGHPGDHDLAPLPFEPSTPPRGD